MHCHSKRPLWILILFFVLTGKVWGGIQDSTKPNNSFQGNPSSNKDKSFDPVYKEKRWFFLHVGIAPFINSGDWAHRYPTSVNVPLSIEYDHRSSFSIGLQYAFLIGSDVNDNELYPGMTDEDDYLIDINGYPAVVRTYQRGFAARAYGLKNWILHKGRDHRWLLQVGAGIGMYEHYTKFAFDVDQVPQIDGIYTEGYAMRTRGPQVSQQLRVQYINNEAISFSLGFEAAQGFGTRTSPYDFSAQKSNQGTYSDNQWGGTFSIMIPIKYSDRISEVDYYMD